MKKIIMLLLCVLLLTACVPTPTEEIIKSRRDNTLQNAIRSAPVAPYQFQHIEQWNDEWIIRGQKIVVDATVESSHSQQYQVLTIKNRYFDKNECISWMKSILGNDLSIREGNRSYEEILEDLQIAVRGWFVDIDEETGDPIYEEYDGQQELITQLKKELALTDPEETYTDIGESVLSFPGSGIKIKQKDGTCWYLLCNSSHFYLSQARDGMIQFEDWIALNGGYPGEKGHLLENIQISEQEAFDYGSKIIQQMERTDLKPGFITRARMIHDNSHEVISEGYYIMYVSAPEGTVPCDYRTNTNCYFLDFTNKETLYCEDWIQEQVAVFVSEKGILSIEWNNPKEIVSVANDNVELLPFAEIQKSIHSLFEYGVNGDTEDTIYINRIVLGSSIQQIPNQGNEAFLVPTWVVYMTSDNTEKMHFAKPVLLISALDGNYVR